MRLKMEKEVATDLGVGLGLVSVPLWVQYLAQWMQVVVLLGGAAIVLFRAVKVMIAFYKWWDNQRRA